MALITSNMSKLLLPGLRKIYGDEYGEWKEEYSVVFDVDSSAKHSEEDQGITGFGLVPEKAQGESIRFDIAYQGYTKRYTHVTYGLGFIITQEMWEDALYRNIKRMPKALARSTKSTVEILAANYLNLAFSATQLGADGVELCSAVHPLVGGGVFRNTLSVPADLDITSFEQALIDIQEFVCDRGLKIAARPLMLVVHPSNDFQAQYILKSDRLPDTANNNYNPARGILPRGHVIMHWLTDPDAWFIKTDVPYGLTFLWRRRPVFKDDTDFNAENAKFKVSFRCSGGWTDPRGVFGSPGA